MLRAIRKAWERYVASLPKTEVVDSIPESQWGSAERLPRISKARRRHFDEFLHMVFAHLPSTETEERMASARAALEESDDIDEAILRALQPEDAGLSDGPGVIICDWKAVEEVQWQADILCHRHGVPLGWSAQERTLTASLVSLEKWLQTHGIALLSFSVGDTAVAFGVRLKAAPAVLAIGKKLRVRIGGPSEA